MQAYQIQDFTSLDGLKRVELPDPKPGHGQVLMRVRAASLNYRDLVVAQGRYSSRPRLNLIPLCDGAGEVIAAGPGVTRFKVGDRVAANFFQNWVSGTLTKEKFPSDLGASLDGTLAEQVVMREEGLVRVPQHLSFEEAATLPCAALTAWNALVCKGRLRAGESVLLLGTGGVSIFALQLAKLHGARVIVTSKSDEKLARARELGADETINYQTHPSWDERVYELTGKVGVDLVVEVGGVGTLERSLKAVRMSGRVALIGVLTSGAGQVNPMSVLWKSVDLLGIYVGSVEMFEEMNRAVTQAKLRPVIDRVFEFGEARAAYDYLKAANHFGKVVIRVSA